MPKHFVSYLEIEIFKENIKIFRHVRNISLIRHDIKDQIKATNSTGAIRKNN